MRNDLPWLGYKPEDQFETRLEYLQNAVPAYGRGLGMYRHLLLRAADWSPEEIEELAYRETFGLPTQLPDETLSELVLAALYRGLSLEALVYKQAWENFIKAHPDALLMHKLLQRLLADKEECGGWGECSQGLRDAICYLVTMMHKLAGGAEIAGAFKDPFAKEALQIYRDMQNGHPANFT